MISLGGLAAVPGGYQTAQKNMYDLQAAQQQQQAMAAYGQALAALANQQGPIPTSGNLPQLPTSQVGSQPISAFAPPPQAPAPSGVGALTGILQQRYGNAQPTVAQAWAPGGRSAVMGTPPAPQGVPPLAAALQARFGNAQPTVAQRWAPGGPSAAFSAAPPPAPPQASQATPPQQTGAPPLPSNASPYASAISGIESGGDYTLLGPKTKNGDYAIGRYQVMASNVPSWTKEVLGTPMTPDQFRANPQAQDAVFNGKFGQYVQETGSPAQAALKWFTGRSDPGALGLKDSLGTSGQDYVNKFNAGYTGGGQAPAQFAGLKLPSTQGVQPGSLTWPAVVNAIKAANPKISPQVLAQAVTMFTPLMTADQQEKWKAVDEQRQNYQAMNSAKNQGVPTGYRYTSDGNLEPIPGGPSDPNTADVDNIVQGIMSGKLPPTGTYYKSTTAVKAGLARAGYDLSKATSEYNAYQSYLKSANSSTQLKYRESASTAAQSLDLLQDLTDQWNNGGFPILNRTTMETAKTGALGPQAQSIATRLDAQIAEVTSTLGAAIMGGNSPTDHSLSLAATQLKGAWSKQTLTDAIKQARENLQYRLNALNQQSAVGTGGSNAYAPQNQPAPAQATQPQTQQPAAPTGPAPDGTIIQGPDGNKLIKQNGKWMPFA